MVEKEVEDSLKLYEVLEQKNIPFHKLTVKEMHMLYHSYYSCIFETVLHDYTEEEALQCTNTLAKLFTAGVKRMAFDISKGQFFRRKR